MTANYSRLERQIARALAHFPVVKSGIKQAYRKIGYARYKKGYTHKSAYPISSFGGAQEETFFGYYDRSPESANGEVLSHVSTVSSRKKPSAGCPIHVAVFDAEREEKFRLPANAYNWQQGARPLWAGSHRFIYNSFDEAQSRYVAHLVSAEDGGTEARYQWPVQDVFSDQYFLSLNYRRLMALRPDYGYRNMPVMTAEELSKVHDDGIWRVEQASGASRLLYTIADAIALPSVKNFSAGVHKFNHAMISPQGDQFIVLHRRYVDGRREDRLLWCRADGSEMRLLLDAGMVSHCTWLDNGRVLGFLRDSEGRDGYRILDTASGTIAPFASGRLDGLGDGHPHASGQWFVTDTYPNRAAMQSLLLGNWKTGKIREVGEFFHDLAYRDETRCDLHPRLSPNCKRIYFDSVFSGIRKLAVMPVDLT